MTACSIALIKGEAKTTRPKQQPLQTPKTSCARSMKRRVTEFDTQAKNRLSRGVWGGGGGVNFEILLSQGLVFLHFEAAENEFQ